MNPNLWREYLTELAKKIAKISNPDVEKITNVIMAHFSLAEKKPTDSFAQQVLRGMMSK
jgi:hypothetical protein